MSPHLRGNQIATFNVNGVNGRLPRLLEWLAESNPDVACLHSEHRGHEKPSDHAPVWITLDLEAGRQIRPGILYLD